MRAVPIIIAAIVVLAVPLVWLGVTALLPPGEQSPAGSVIDSGARIEIEQLRQQIEGMQEQLAALQDEIASLDLGGTTAEYLPLDEEVPRDGPNAILGEYASVVQIANRRNVNAGITTATPSFLEGFLGRPREVLSDECESMTNPKLAAMLVTQQVGPITVKMLQPALDSLTAVLENVRRTDQDLYDRISTAGSLCVRRIRGTIDRTSSHSFGLAVDLNIDGQLDTLGDGKTQLGLTILKDFFRSEGWIWGAGFSREDSMHFEVSREMLEKWRADGRI
jgi:hypothetical protein